MCTMPFGPVTRERKMVKNSKISSGPARHINIPDFHVARSQDQPRFNTFTTFDVDGCPRCNGEVFSSGPLPVSPPRHQDLSFSVVFVCSVPSSRTCFSCCSSGIRAISGTKTCFADALLSLFACKFGISLAKLAASQHTVAI